jgi:hypothetical protein
MMNRKAIPSANAKAGSQGNTYFGETCLTGGDANANIARQKGPAVRLAAPQGFVPQDARVEMDNRESRSPFFDKKKDDKPGLADGHEILPGVF